MITVAAITMAETVVMVLIPQPQLRDPPADVSGHGDL